MLCTGEWCVTLNSWCE